MAGDPAIRRRNFVTGAWFLMYPKTLVALMIDCLDSDKFGYNTACVAPMTGDDGVNVVSTYGKGTCPCGSEEARAGSE